MRLGIDVDGVLANFNDACIERYIEVCGVDLFPPRPFEIPTWDYPELYGYTDTQIEQVWKSIKTDYRFWRSLPLYSNTLQSLFALDLRMKLGDDVYFITSRPGVLAKAQTESWLHMHWPQFNVPRLTVLISSHKGLCAQALELDAYIDDRDKNVIKAASIHWKGKAPACRTFLLNRPWNRDMDTEKYNVCRVSSISEMLLTLDNIQTTAA